MEPDLDRLRPGDEAPAEPPYEPTYEPTSRSLWPWLGLAVVTAIILGAAWTLRRAPAPAPTASVASPTVEAPVSRPATPDLGIGEPDPNLPSLDGLDAYLRPLLGALSSRPELTRLLASDDLIRRFVVSVDRITRGESPARQVRAIAPTGAFSVRPRGNSLEVAPASLARYDGIVGLVEDLDPQRLARIYGQIKPRLDEAYAELGTGTSFDEAMARALEHLLAAPLPPASIEVAPGKSVNYVYVDPALEARSPAQRHLMRLGPERMARVQAKLRAFASAIGAQ